MSIVTPMQKQALQYVVNTGANASRDHFLEDHDPIGQVLWTDLELEGLVTLNEHDKIILTDKGHDVLGGA